MSADFSSASERVAVAVELARLNQRQLIHASWFNLVVSLSFWVGLPLLTWCWWRWVSQPLFVDLLPYFYLGPWIFGLVGVCWTMVWQLPQYRRLQELTRQQLEWNRVLASRLQAPSDAESPEANSHRRSEQSLWQVSSSREALATRFRLFGQAIVTGVVLSVCWFCGHQETKLRLSVSFVPASTHSANLEHVVRTLAVAASSEQRIAEALGLRIPAWVLITVFGLPLLVLGSALAYRRRSDGLRWLGQSLAWLRQNKVVRWCAVRLPVALLFATVYYFTLESAWKPIELGDLVTAFDELARITWPSFLVPLLFPLWALGVAMLMRPSGGQPRASLLGVPSESPPAE